MYPDRSVAQDASAWRTCIRTDEWHKVWNYLPFTNMVATESYDSTKHKARKEEASLTPVLSRKYASTEQEVRQSQAGGTPVPAKWDSSPKQVGLASDLYVCSAPFISY